MNKELLIQVGRDKALGTISGNKFYNAMHSVADAEERTALEVGWLLYSGAPRESFDNDHRRFLESATIPELQIWERVNPGAFAVPKTLRDSDPEVDAFYGVLKSGGARLHAVELTAAKRHALLTKEPYACALRAALKGYLVREYPEWMTLEFRKELKTSWGGRFKI